MRRHSQPGRPGPPPSPRLGIVSEHFAGIATALVLSVALAAVFFYRSQGGAGYPLDDSWIHLAYARNLATGLGFGANPHEPTPGATSPLWVLMLAPGFLLGLDHSIWPWLLAGLWLGSAGLASAWLVLRLGAEDPPDRRSGLHGAALACGVTVALTAPLVWSAAGAMEVPLFCTLICVALALHDHPMAEGPRRGALWGAAAGLAALARPEGLLLAVLLVAARALRRTRRDLAEAGTGLGMSAAVYAPSALFCLATSGRIFPNTFYAKTTALVAGMPDPAFLLHAGALYWKLAPVVLLAFVVGIAALGRRMRGGHAPGTALLAAIFVLSLPTAYGAMGRTFLFAGLAGNFGRYLYPVMPAALALGFWGSWALLEGLPARRARWTRIALTVAAISVTTAGSIERVGLYVRNVEDIDTMQVELAERLGARLEPGSLVAANDVGALAYLTPLRVLDLIGIISTQTLDALEEAGPEPASRARALRELLEHERPQAVAVFPGWFSGTLERLGARRSIITEVENPDNITSGQSRIVAYRLYWPTETISDRSGDAHE